MSTEAGEPKREYVGFIRRLLVLAKSGRELRSHGVLI